MKQSAFRQSIVILRVCVVTFLLSVLALVLLSFTVASSLSNDVWKQIGMPQDKATEKIRKSFIDNYFDQYGIRQAKGLIGANKAAVAKDLLVYSKQYLSSQAFRTDYEKAREASKPAPSSISIAPASKEDVRKEKIEETEKAIQKTKETIKKSDAEMQKIMQPVLESQEQMLAAYKEPNSIWVDAVYNERVQRVQADNKSAEESLKRWQNDYPADAKQMLRSRLERYLRIAATVDFNAQLTDRYNKKVFVNPVYESKSNEWKMIFRAGKEVYDQSRPFAEQWLKELQ